MPDKSKKLVLTPETTIIFSCGSYSEEYGSQKWKDVKTIKEIAETLTQEYPKEASDIKTLMDTGDFHGIIGVYMDYNDEYTHNWETEEETLKEEKRQRLIILERTAKQFSIKCGHPVASEEFVLAAWKEMNHQQANHDEHFSGESVSERYMDARYAGATEHFHEDEQYSREHDFPGLATIHDVMEWLEQECPLLMAKCEEKRAELMKEE